MEPWRPAVDGAVARWVREHGTEAPLDRELIETITGRYQVGGEARTLFDVLSRTAASLVAVFAGGRRGLVLPEA